MYTKAKLEARAFILNDVDDIWVLNIKDKETLFTAVSPKQILVHLQSICGGLHAINVLQLQNEM